MGRRRDEKRDQYWLDLIAEQKSSDLTITDFCRVKKIHLGSFFSWRKKLSKLFPSEPQPIETKTPSAKFVPVELPLPARATFEPGVEILLPSGCRIVVPPKFSVDSLRDILCVLKESSC